VTEPAVPFLTGLLCLFKADTHKADSIAGAELTQYVQIRSDDVGDLGVATHRLSVHPKDERLTIVSDLHRSGCDGFGKHLLMLFGE
jgi:hypothetical protein